MEMSIGTMRLICLKVEEVKSLLTGARDPGDAVAVPQGEAKLHVDLLQPDEESSLYEASCSGWVPLRGTPGRCGWDCYAHPSPWWRPTVESKGQRNEKIDSGIIGESNRKEWMLGKGNVLGEFSVGFRAAAGAQRNQTEFSFIKLA